MTSRVHEEPDNLVSIAADVALDAAWRALPAEFRERNKPIVIVLIQSQEGPLDDESCTIAARGATDDERSGREAMKAIFVELVTAARVVWKQVEQTPE